MKKVWFFKKKSSINYQDQEYNKALDIQKSIANRLIIFGLTILSLMFIIVGRFYYVQIIQTDYYQQRLDIYTQRLFYVSSPRGEITDRYGNVLTANTEELAITYLPPLRVSDAEKWRLAQLFASTFEVNYDFLRFRDLQDLLIARYPSVANGLITSLEWEQYRQRELSDHDIYQLKLQRITPEMTSALSDLEKATWVIKSAMDVPTGGRPKVIKEKASKAEVAYLVEHIDMFRGFDIAISWSRNYPFGVVLRPILGSVTTASQGLPAESLLSYLALDYARNDNVGRSGLEQQYEDLLLGSRSVYRLNYNDDGLGVLTSQIDGSKGMNIKTAFDINWQIHAEEVIKNALLEHQDNPFRKYMNTINFVILDPNNGDVLVMTSITLTENGFIFDPASTYNKAMPVGSSVKAAMVYMGLNEGVVAPGEIIIDQPIKIRDTPAKASYINLGRVNDLTALSLSSNVYMFHVAMRLGGANYVYDGPLRIDLNTFTLMRNYFSQFGLGTYTQVDLPNEQTGFKGSATLGGLLLDFAIGQYDTYTTLQLAQYVATIANNGNRIAPRVVLDASSSESGEILYQNNVKLLNVIDNKSALSRVQQGLRLCVSEGGCRGAMTRLSVPFAAKTGTAENTVMDDNNQLQSSPNSILISYGPYDRPEVATACTIANAWNTQSQVNLCLSITAEILKYRYE